MKDLQKSISLNGWYSTHMEWTQTKSKAKDQREFLIKYNQYGFITNPYLKEYATKPKRTANESDFT